MSSSEAVSAKRVIPALRFKQWLDRWNDYDFSEEFLRRKPPEHIYMFSLRAAELRALSDVYKRERQGSAAEGIQRVRDTTRTGRIQNYVRYGYPYGDLKEPQRTDETSSLRKPGWLPTAIVINILLADDERHGRKVSEGCHAAIKDLGDGRFEIIVPSKMETSEGGLAPFEVIDGQHRLWAFDAEVGEEPLPDDFELPVVAYHGLDISWQAYLFWSINVSPKRINPSHAFDLYPLLRTQDWLDRVGELNVYREARAQELTEQMYAHESSPWRNRINMLGERGGSGVSQAAWVRTLLQTFLSTGRGQGRAGLFQANLSDGIEPLDWTRSQQTAFIIRLWSDISASLERNKNLYWIRKFETPEMAFEDKRSMLNQDQGLRAIHAAANDIFYHSAQVWQLDRWILRSNDDIELYSSEVSSALLSLDKQPFRQFIAEFADQLTYFDWRSFDGPGVRSDEGGEELLLQKRAYRGSGGYAVLREDLLRKLTEANGSVGRTASTLLFEMTA
ncbi:DGQHR domain-containing protein [Methylobacterium radiodurans]|uniref:DGQHR domain-containing protein n=1 Tax=Methylobacterium radiodurans TaxID=2202828 RepID=A0A2U8VQK0_9HYPH|nr:DGQHR domain-containing protein [Methylobacterium radiodurans]AWN35953.1 hypothetical protein DK427_09595 [Methylobacterium radiodurans]